MRYNFKQLVITRLLAENLLLFLLQFTGMMFSVFGPQPLPVDFAAGTAAAFIFMRGYTILPGIWLGTCCAGLLASLSLLHASTLATAYTVQTALLFCLCLRFVSPGLIFINKQLFLKFVLLCTGLALLFSPLLISWQADMAGLLIVTLAISYWDNYFPEIKRWRSIYHLRVIAGLFTIALIINLTTYVSNYNYMNYMGLLLYTISVGVIFPGIRHADMK